MCLPIDILCAMCTMKHGAKCLSFNLNHHLRNPKTWMTLIWGLQEKNPALENKFAAVTSRAVSSECVWPCFQRFPLKHIVREIAGSSKGRGGGGNLCCLSAGGGGALVAQQHRYTAHRCVFNSLRKLRIAFLMKSVP